MPCDDGREGRREDADVDRRRSIDATHRCRRRRRRRRTRRRRPATRTRDPAGSAPRAGTTRRRTASARRRTRRASSENTRRIRPSLLPPARRLLSLSSAGQASREDARRLGALLSRRHAERSDAARVSRLAARASRWERRRMNASSSLNGQVDGDESESSAQVPAVIFSEGTTPSPPQFLSRRRTYKTDRGHHEQ